MMCMTLVSWVDPPLHPPKPMARDRSDNAGQLSSADSRPMDVCSPPLCAPCTNISRPPLTTIHPPGARFLTCPALAAHQTSKNIKPAGTRIHHCHGQLLRTHAAIYALVTATKESLPMCPATPATPSRPRPAHEASRHCCCANHCLPGIRLDLYTK